MYSDEELYNLIGEKIKNRRKSLGITQEKLAEITHYSLSFIANIESKTYQTFSITALNNIANALNTTILNLIPKDGELENTTKVRYYYIRVPEEVNKPNTEGPTTITNIYNNNIYYIIIYYNIYNI